MPVSALTTSLCATGAGADEAMILSASLVISAPCSMASTGVRCPSSSPSSEASQRRTFVTISPWVSPSNDSVGMRETLPGEQVRAESPHSADDLVRGLPLDEVAAVAEEERTDVVREHHRGHAVEVRIDHVVRRAEENERLREVLRHHRQLAS